VKPADPNSPLYQLFTELRLTGLPLGLTDYEAVLRAVQGGLAREEREDLAKLCRALWVKSRDPAYGRLFDHHFAVLIPKTFGEKQQTQPETLRPVTEKPEVETKTPEATTAVSPTDDDIELDPLDDEGAQTQPTDSAYQSLAQMEAMSAYEDEALVAEATRRQLEIVSEFYVSFSADYLPVTSRQMKQNWRYLRRAARSGPPVELDIEATVDRIARDGFLADPVLRPRRVNRAQLVLLIDRDGSMVPFHSLGRRLQASAQDGGRLGAADVYYFHDCPGDFLYPDPYYQEFVAVPDVVAQLHPMHTSVLIFGDGGAARGRFDPARVRQTAVFLAKLQQTVRHIAWLNPMPQARWSGSSAGQIAEMIPMFETNRLGLQGAIKALRGRRPHALE
jgi:uncharacterized protein